MNSFPDFIVINVFEYELTNYYSKEKNENDSSMCKEKISLD